MKNFQISKFPNFQISKFFEQFFLFSSKFLVIFFLCNCQNSFAQIYGTHFDITDTSCPRQVNSYPVGVGIPCPTDGLHVGTTATFENLVRFKNAGRFENLQIGEFSNSTGLTLPAFQMSNIDANGQTTTTFQTNRWGGSFMWQRGDAVLSNAKIVEFGGIANGNHYFRLYDQINDGDSPITEFNTRGTSYIGTKLKIGFWGGEGSYMLAVGGKIAAKEEVRVFFNNVFNFPDYVFEIDYQLPKLTDIEAYIQKYKHLPEVPSAKEVEKEGMSLNEMNIILLKKIEELTLYTIEQEKRIKALEEENDKLKKLEKRIQVLEAKKP
ncbi:MAG: hypothetical protein SFU27_02445 [Thermonemataceae bacterium]|nr:hypothetical protein [Thermonemataceae bacterium]